MGKKPKTFKKRQTKEVNRLIATQLTDTEQAIITSVHPTYTSAILVDGDYDLELLLVKISEANAKFHRSYKPTQSIRTYINNRNEKHRKGLTPLLETLQALKPHKKGKSNKDSHGHKKKRSHFLMENGEHTAKGTLKFLKQTFVKSSGDSLHIVWTSILLHTRKDGVSMYGWCRS